MPRIRIGKSDFLLLVLFTFSFSRPVYAQRSENRDFDFSYLDRKINGWVDSGFYHGAAILIAKNNKVIHKKYYGNYGHETVAYIASAGKWLAAATIATVVDQGKLAWNDPAGKWIPDLKGEMAKATLLQLLSHTAGYPDYQPKEAERDHYQTLTESVQHIIPLFADTLPGTKFKYGGLAMQVAGRMAEIATDKSWEEIFQQNIAVPLEMKYTHFTPVDDTPGHSPMLGGGARANLDDYANFLNMLCNDGIFKGKRVLSAKSIAEMQADQIGNARVSQGEYVQMVRADQRKDIYGLGEWREEVNRKGDAELISSPSWAGAYPWIDKKNHVYGFFLARIAEMKNGFNSFYASPVLPILVRDVIDQKNDVQTKVGYITTADGAKLYYEERGEGIPLIFIHGHSFDRRSWDPQFYEFAKKYKVIRYDLRGYGWSTVPSEKQTAMHADDLAALMDKLGIKKAHLVGLSLGGFIVSDFIALYPQRILSATASSGDFFNVEGPSTPWTQAEWDKQSIKINEWQKKGIMAMKKEWFDGLTIRNGKILTALRKPIWEMIYKWDAWQPQHHEPRFLLGKDLSEKLEKTTINFPVMILTGEVDSGKKNRLKTAIPSAVQVFIPKAGHVSNLENPDAFNQKLSLFLTGKVIK
jgi:CubicO group peptidase (beta-lactamase class C family)/pimeloyl-ACP methyl ester carboxylesterase